MLNITLTKTTQKNRSLCDRCASRPHDWIASFEDFFPEMKICDECAKPLKYSQEEKPT